MNKLLEKLRDKIQAIKDYRLKRKVLRGRRGLIRRYEYQLQTEMILEQWVIQNILDGKVERRKELAEKQAQIKEITEFIKYLKKQ